MKRLLIGATFLSVLASPRVVQAQAAGDTVLASVLNSVNMHNLGPFRSGAWVTSIAAPETPAREHRYTIYAGVRSGGLWKTSNNGITWEPVTDSIGTVINEKTPNQLFAAMYDKERLPWQIVESGPESGIYRSDDGGEKWTRLTTGLPGGKIGRIGLDLYQRDIEPKARYGFGRQGMNYKLYGDRFLSVPNEPEAIVINYYLKADQPAGAKVTVTDVNGRVMLQLDGPGQTGMNRVLWPLAGGGGRGPGGGGVAPAGPPGPAIPATAGDYTVTVEVAGEKLTKPARVRERIGA